MILLNLSFQDKLKSHPVQKPLRQLPAFGHPELRDVASSQKGLSFSLALNSKIIPPPPTPQADHPILSCTANCWPDLSPPPATWYEIPLPPFFLPFSVFFCCTATTGQQESSDPIQMTDDRQTKGVYRSSLGFGKSVHSFFYPHQLLGMIHHPFYIFSCLI
ncbi:hypothetical protein AABB24_022926 [Solanum stoloniferum]|uniref:Uncharacterized protein n=1 Tax=Solanum stoloniferum TaxID=62892 RepID=A0ABD2T298_9SOLN